MRSWTFTSNRVAIIRRKSGCRCSWSAFRTASVPLRILRPSRMSWNSWPARAGVTPIFGQTPRSRRMARWFTPSTSATASRTRPRPWPCIWPVDFTPLRRTSSRPSSVSTTKKARRRQKNSMSPHFTVLGLLFYFRL